MTKTILAVTGGGHVDFGPAVQTLVSEAKERGWNILGSLYGWNGVEEDNGSIVDLSKLSPADLRDIHDRGTTPIFSSRTNPDSDKVNSTKKKYGVTNVIAFGGDDTLSVDPDCVGWPKTMDNNHGPQSDKWDLSPGTYFDIGYPTAASRAAKETAWAVANAQANGTVHLIVPFGRSQDYVALAAAAHGGADFMVPGEKELYFEDLFERIQDARMRNADEYKCRPFAVIVIPEGVNAGDAEGLFEGYGPTELTNYARKYIKTDSFGHPKLMPELVYLMAMESILKRGQQEPGSKRINKVTGKVLTYHLRDGPGTTIDERMGKACAVECLNLIEEDKLGRMATVRWDDDRNEFYTDSIPIRDAVKERYVDGTGFFDYDETWQHKQKWERYAEKFLGPVPDREQLVHPSKRYWAAHPLDD